jgi:hypothetical protein
MTIGRDLLTKAETVMVAAIEAGVPTLVEAREIITQFHLMIRRRLETGLTPWIERARASLIASFASGVARDEAAVRAAITSSWSNGQTEGQITRLKLVRRQMYWSRENRFASSQISRRGVGAAPKLRQSQIWEPIDSRQLLLGNRRLARQQMSAAPQIVEFPQFGPIECRAKAERTHRAIGTEQLIWFICSPGSPHAALHDNARCHDPIARPAYKSIAFYCVCSLIEINDP